ncbi:MULTISPECIES: hypothetical protein [Nocardia]|uniref:Uncharacterized protein n=1 Tax=Nocardia abscessus TaxID=120957 RepID=A0ABS0C1S5_9NOCA|nr:MULTISPECIES: hypothetical protein [Nocardia]MBF6221017.1 hypothetical protein [Nocardia abscessus]MBF6223586.1 hypothetical protein [Nocardia abscessus]MBF6334882.1 hypothetical protein [Nocardia abscessus]MBF6476008.1 hypothetical protein [Nocardia abscessus]MCC3327741.1 hypothetical protein [Nocardia abscessus]
MTRSEFAELRYAVGQLRQSIGVLRTQFGDASTVRRLENDLERLVIDADELEQSPPPEVQRRPQDVIYVPDSKSDEAAWMGAQDEGLGFHSRPRTK